VLFNSAVFFIFFAFFYAVYLRLPHRLQNKWLLAASCIFYGSWDWRFLLLIFTSITTDYFCARAMGKTSVPARRKFLLGISAAVNFGILGFFKYFNFFADSFERLAALWDWTPDFLTLHILLPVGISFYTFQSFSYTVDVYRGQIKPIRRYQDFALFVMFFPQLVAGPIERAAHLLPQLQNPRRITREHIDEGAWLFFRGLFKKVFIADNLAPIAAAVFTPDATALSAPQVLIGLYAFAFQIYGDFSGYSDMARGLAKLLGVDICLNFRFPYFVTSPREFWKNWHISLSTWLRDYVYIPLGGNRGGGAKIYRNLMLTMLLGGLWHGAAWHFVVWGGYHGLLLCLQHAWEARAPKMKTPQNSKSPLRLLIQIVIMFHITCVGWLFFRADSMTAAGQLLQVLVTGWGPDLSGWVIPHAFQLIQTLWLLLLMEGIAWARQNTEYERLWAWPLRAGLYTAVFYYIVLYGEKAQEFIYFQF